MDPETCVRTFSGLGMFLSQHLVSRDEEQEDGYLATGAAVPSPCSCSRELKASP